MKNRPPSPPRPSADLAPMPAGKRLWLLTVLIILPFALVCVPAVLMFQYSNRQWTFASWGKSRGEPDVSALRGSLERTAQKDLPAPEALDAGAIELRSTAERAPARVAKITRLAQQFGGSAAEGLPAENEKRFYVELPAGRAEAFREAAKTGTAPAAMPSPSAGKEHLEVVLHLGDE